MFQSTRPCEGATRLHAAGARAHGCFNPRARVRARPNQAGVRVTGEKFQSTRPCEGATNLLYVFD